MKTSIRKRILDPQFTGTLDPREGMRLLVHEEEGPITSSTIKLFLLVDEEDGVIADAAFQVYGPSYLILAAEILCELCIRKTHVQAGNLHGDFIEKSSEPFPQLERKWINFSLSALDGALEGCKDMVSSVQTPLMQTSGEEKNYEEEFPLLSLSEKISLIESIIDDEIRPYIEMDEGGVVIEGLEGFSLKIRYEGACTSCYASTGSTLSAIQGILQQKVHPDLTVTPVGVFA